VTNDIHRLKQLYYDIPQLVRRLKPDVCLTLGDLGPVSLSCRHVIFLHNSLFLYSSAELNGKAWPPVKRHYLPQHFAWSIKYAGYIVVQLYKHRLCRNAWQSANPRRIIEIAQPVPDHITHSSDTIAVNPRIEIINKPVRLLFLAAYYPHKNHSVLPAVARELERRDLTKRVHIFTTLEDSPNEWGKIKHELAEYSECITNLGRLLPTEVGDSLRASTALFLPTITESYGLIYLEAMACGRPILTSDRDFARWMCQDLAIYFDPFDASSIVDAIESLLDFQRGDDYRSRVIQRLKAFPQDWNEVAKAFDVVLCQAAEQVVGDAA